MEGRGISGFIICLIPAVFANHEVQSPLCSCRQGTVASVRRWHVPTGTLEVCAACTPVRSEIESVRQTLFYTPVWLKLPHSAITPHTHKHTHQASDLLLDLIRKGRSRRGEMLYCFSATICVCVYVCVCHGDATETIRHTCRSLYVLT